MTPTQDGGALIVGSYWPFDDPDFAEVEFYLLKIDSLGNEEWSDTYWWSGYNARLTSAVCTPDGGYLVGGGRSNGNTHIMTYMKLDSEGNLEWIEDIDALCMIKISPLPNNEYLLTTCLGSFEIPDIYFIKLDSNFDIVWEKNHEGHPMQRTIYSDPYIKEDGGFIATTSYPNSQDNAEVNIIDFDSDGNINWTQTYTANPNEDCFLRDIEATPDGGYVLAGAQFSGFQKGWLLKIDSLGRTCEIPDCDTLILTECLNTPDSVLCCAAVGDFPISMFSFIEQDSLSISLNNQSTNLYQEYNNGAAILWDFGDGNTSTEFSPTHTYTEANYYDITLSVFLCGDTTSVLETVKVGEPVGIEIVNNYEVKVYPNPATTSLTFEYVIENAETLFLYNALGQVIQEIELKPSLNSRKIATANFIEGVYYWQLGEKRGKVLVAR